MKQFTITGMSCAACQALIEKTVSRIPGVNSVSVSLLTNSMSVEGTVDDDIIIRAVKGIGYGAELNGIEKNVNTFLFGNENIFDNEVSVLKRRLFSSIVFLIILIYISMGHNMWKWPMPDFLDRNPVSLGIIQMFLSFIIMLINKKFFVSGFKSVFHGAPNMDTLVALGSSSSFIWSIYALFMMTDALGSGEVSVAIAWNSELYFESASMILVLITIGKMLEAKSKGRTTDALQSLIKLSPRVATVIKDDKKISIPIEDVVPGDIIEVKPGESIPADGIIIEGDTAVNESALTGESIPIDKLPGDLVSAATMNQSGYIKCKVLRVGNDTTLSQIIKIVSDAAATKAPIARTADKVSGIFVPAVVAISAVTLITWLLIGKSFDFALARAISVLVISCPCALGLATPVAIMVGNGVGAKHGVLFKNAAALEETGRVQIIALDKTGTLTHGEPNVDGIYPAEGISEEELLAIAFSIESKSEHPLARAIVREAEKRGCTALPTEEFRALPGNGLTAVINGEIVYGGSVSFIAPKLVENSTSIISAERIADNGSTPIMFIYGKKYLGIIAITDKIKDDCILAIQELCNIGLQVVMLTGDNKRTANAIGRLVGIDKVVSGVKPNEKAFIIESLREIGKVAMVGDGINDAPALTSANIGMAIGAGTDVAIDAADVVLMNSKLADVVTAFKLSKSTLKNIRENLFWAFFYNILCIPLAAGCYINIFGWALSPMIGAAAMSLSSFCVVMNALRLNLFDSSLSKHSKHLNKPIDSAQIEQIIDTITNTKEEKPMTKKIIIEGMMCTHCEAHTKKALEAIEGVDLAIANHTDGTAIVTLSQNIDDTILKSAVEQAGYTVLGIE